MDSVKPDFSSAHEELLDDTVSIEDIDEDLEKLATAGIAGTETDEHEDKTEEYLQWTIEGIQNIRKLYKRGLKELTQLNAEQKVKRGKTSKKLLRLRRKVARTRLEIVQEISVLHLKEAVRQRLI